MSDAKQDDLNRDLQPIALLVSDLHLSLTPPVARSLEPNWLTAQERYFQQLTRLKQKHGVPVICAGDIFHRWSASAEIINWALAHLPDMLAIPGQHDLPFHCYEDVHRSAYWTLVEAGKIKNLSPGEGTAIGKGFGVLVYGFPWGFEVEGPPLDAPPPAIKIAVVHAYCWQKGSTFPGAPVGQMSTYWRKRLKGFDFALFGDNHKGFTDCTTNPIIYNHGAFIPRSSDERHWIPRVGILYRKKPLPNSTRKELHLQEHHLVVEDDVWLPEEDPRLIEERTFTVRDFVKELREMGEDDTVDFESALKTYFRTYEISEGARKIIMQAVHKHTTS